MSGEARILSADASVTADMFGVRVMQAAPQVTAAVTFGGDGLAVEGSAGTPQTVTVEFGPGEFGVRDVTEEAEEVLVHFMPFIEAAGGGGAATSMTQAEYDALTEAGTVDEDTIYLIRLDGELQRIYAGTTLVAQKGVPSVTGFPYTFPIIFG